MGDQRGPLRTNGEMGAEDFTQQRSVEETDYLEISEEPQVYLLTCLPL